MGEKTEECKRCLKSVWGWLMADKSRAMKVLAMFCGVYLILGGILGVLNVLSGLQMVVSFYNCIFGLMIVVTELGTVPLFKLLFKQLDIYFHFLASQRGKGIFYLFVGLLELAMGLHDSQSPTGMVLAVVLGAVGLLNVAKFGDQKDNEYQPPSEAEIQSAPTTATDVAAAILRDNPALVGATIQAAASNPGVAKQVASATMSSSGMGGGTPTGGTQQAYPTDISNPFATPDTQAMLVPQQAYVDPNQQQQGAGTHL